MLRLSMADNKSTWITILPWVLFQLNNLPGLLSKYSPFKIVFGRDPPYIGEIPSLDITHINVDCEDWFVNVDQMRQAVQKHVTKIHERVASQYRSKFGNQVYEVGDKVWVRNSKVRTRSHKLDLLWFGPCEVLERYANTGRYRIVLLQGPDDVHFEDMKPYLHTIKGTAIPFLY